MGHYIGIDISKLTFHAAMDESGAAAVFANDRKGIRRFMKMLKGGQALPADVVIGMESTGHYHLLPALMLAQKGYDVRLINPMITGRRNRMAMRKVKNDRTDARLVRRCLMEGAGRPFRDTAATLRLKNLVRQRSYLADLGAKLKLKQQDMAHKEDCIGESITPVNGDLVLALEAGMKALEKELAACCPELQKLLMSIPGVGRHTAATLVAEVGDISLFPDAGKLTAFTGLDPRVHESGTSIHGKGYISKRGSGLLRRRLYNAASAAVLHPPNDFYDFFQKKRTEGKPYRVALCAVMRKMLHAVHAVWTRGTPYVIKKPLTSI